MSLPRCSNSECDCNQTPARRRVLGWLWLAWHAAVLLAGFVVAGAVLFTAGAIAIRWSNQ